MHLGRIVNLNVVFLLKKLVKMLKAAEQLGHVRRQSICPVPDP